MSTLTEIWGNEEVERAAWHMARLYRAERARHLVTITVAIVTGVVMLALTIAATFYPWPRPVMLALPMSVSMPACPSEDGGLPHCVWDADTMGNGQRDPDGPRWLIYPGRT